MKKRVFRTAVNLVAVALTVGVVGAAGLHGQSIAGHWEGSRGGRNPLNGMPFSVNFAFDFDSVGTFREVASFGNWKILQVTGTYQVNRGRNPRDPTVTHLLVLQPQRADLAPNDQAKMLLESAYVANTEATEQFVTFFNVAPMGGMSLKNTAGGDTWGMNRVR